MPLQILAWNQMFQQLNSAQIGFDVIHPQLSVTITDPAQLQALATGSALRVNVGLESVPSGMFELKANALSLQLNKGVTSQSAAGCGDAVHAGTCSAVDVGPVATDRDPLHSGLHGQATATRITIPATIEVVVPTAIAERAVA
jgi:hypothetical protein